MATSNDSLNDEDYQYVLRKNEKKIANLINPTCLFPVLHDKKLLTEDEVKLLQGTVPEKKGARLVQILLGKKGGNVLHVFIQALREDEEHVGHKSLAFELLAELSNPPLLSSFRSRAASLPVKPVKSDPVIFRRQTGPKRLASISVSASVRM